MQVRSSIPKSVLAALAALAVAAPVAGAVPIYDGHPPHRATGEAYDVNRETGAYTPAGASADMHASTVRRPRSTSDGRRDRPPHGGREEPDRVRRRQRRGAGGTDLRTEAAKARSPARRDVRRRPRRIGPGCRRLADG